MSECKIEFTALKRILLKISGEALAGDQGQGIDIKEVKRICGEVAALRGSRYIEIGIVLGGGNIFRGIECHDYSITKQSADSMGMLATVINGVMLRDVFLSMGIPAKTFANVPMGPICHYYNRFDADKALAEGEIGVFTAGTGSGFFTTDTAATLKALELNCDVMLKATKVKGVFEEDPSINPGAKFYPSLTYDYAIGRKFKVMDSTAMCMAQENNLPIVVFSIKEAGELEQIMKGKGEGSLITN